MLSTDTIIKNMDRMDRIINEYNVKLESLEPTDEILNLKEKIEQYNDYKKDFIHPKKGMFKKISDRAINETIREIQNSISGEILFCFMSKER